MAPRKIQAGAQIQEGLRVEIEASPSDTYLLGIGDLIHPFPMRWPGLLICLGIKLACEKRAVETGKTYDQCLERFLLHCIGVIELANQNEVRPPFRFDTVVGAVWVSLNEFDSLTIR